MKQQEAVQSCLEGARGPKKMNLVLNDLSLLLVMTDQVATNTRYSP